MGFLTAPVTPARPLEARAGPTPDHLDFVLTFGLTLVTLPVEFDASARARLVLRQTGLIRTVEEETALAKVLRAAAWTYVAAFITSLVYFLLHVLPLLGGRRE